MELDRALELAVVSSWEDLVKPGETVEPSNSASPASEVPKLRFANSYRSERLADNLDFILWNQSSLHDLLTVQSMAWSRLTVRVKKAEMRLPLGAKRSILVLRKPFGTRALDAECTSAAIPQPNRAS
jgi:hypothetical protein